MARLPKPAGWAGGIAGSVILSTLTHTVSVVMGFGILCFIVTLLVLLFDRCAQRANLLLRGTALPRRPRGTVTPRATSRDFDTERSTTINQDAATSPRDGSPALDRPTSRYLATLRKSGKTELADRIERILLAALSEETAGLSPYAENLNSPPEL